MISALPLLLAKRTAKAVDAVAMPMGLFSAACRAEIKAPSGTLPAGAGIHATLGGLLHDADVGGRSAGERLEMPFEAEVTLYLVGPKTLPAASPDNGRDLMLSIVLDRLAASDETGGLATDSADILAGGRRLSAQWRFDRLVSITAAPVGSRTIWQLETRFRGLQTLSEVPSEGGHILQVQIDSETATDATQMTARIDATTDDLPISVIANIGPENASQMAAFGVVKLVDLLLIPKVGIDAAAAEIAANDAELRGTLKLLHLFLGLRRGLVLNGINAALLDQRFAKLTLDQVWDGTTFTPPNTMPADQALRLDLMAKPLLPFIRTEAWPRLTLGQLSTAKGEV